MGHFNSGTTDQGDAHGIIVSTRVGKSSLNLSKVLSEKIKVCLCFSSSGIYHLIYFPFLLVNKEYFKAFCFLLSIMPTLYCLFNPLSRIQLII